MSFSHNKLANFLNSVETETQIENPELLTKKSNTSTLVALIITSLILIGFDIALTFLTGYYIDLILGLKLNNMHTFFLGYVILFLFNKSNIFTAYALTLFNDNSNNTDKK